jgi:hypothetical protein
MTRPDLEEAIGNLEYLVLNHFDPAKVHEYDQELKMFRRELAALETGQVSLVSSPLRVPFRKD